MRDQSTVEVAHQHKHCLEKELWGCLLGDMMDLKALPFPLPTCFRSHLFWYEGCLKLPWPNVPHQVEDETLQGAEMGAGELVYDRIYSPHCLLPLLEACGESTSV